jgi:NADPH:quinone reductase-like Zn-dependent oxidoreductase
MPAQLSFEQAATMPTVFMTAHMAFDLAAEVKPGERVLVHAAAGGVGLAAVQVLRERGVVAVATAGGPPKRALLRSLGVQHVAGSRDTAFVEELAVGGKGVDMLLNTLTSPGLVSAALALVSHGGRLVEISKRDIWHAGRAAQERPDLHFGMVAVDFLPGPEVQRAMSRVAAGAASGALCPLPVASHGLRSISSALRQMSQARHVGKVVVSVAHSDPGNSSSPDLPGIGAAAAGGTVAVTGGLGALGLLTASWLASQGASRVILLGRSGRTPSSPHQQGQPPVPGLPPTLLSGGGGLHTALVTATACDIGASEDMVGCLLTSGAAAAEGMPLPSGGLEGVLWEPVHAWFHAGGVLGDASLRNHTLAGLRSVCAPKLSAAANCSLSPSALLQPSGRHVLFSSVASLLGSAG